MSIALSVAARANALSWIATLETQPLRVRPDVLKRVAEVAVETPEALAVVSVCTAEGTALIDSWPRLEKTNLTYHKLLELVHAIGCRLAAAGIIEGSIVAVSTFGSGPPTAGFVAALLAIWSIGATAMPIDAGAPLARISNLLTQANVQWLIETDAARYISAYPGRPTSVTYNLTELSQPSDPHTFGPWRDSLCNRPPYTGAAYVFCSSGSTGYPKLILGRHAGISHFLEWQRETFNVGRNDACLATTNATFDVVLRDLFLVLCAGGTLYLNSDGRVHPLALAALLGVTCLHATPTRLQAWLAPGNQTERLSNLRLLFCAGEPLSVALARRCSELAPMARIVNLYGPTETTLAKCWHEVNPSRDRDPLPVGRPQPEVRVHILDDAGLPCDPYVVGEVVIQTPYRTLGYIGATAELAARFVDLRGGEDGVYFTGDLGSIDVDGVLTLAGRQDDQVKIRGVLVQTAGVETWLNRQPGVLRSRVLAVGNTPLAQHLVAFVVMPVAAFNEEVLRDALATHLPSASIPNQFVRLDDMPVSTNGKIDRQKLLERLVSSESHARNAADEDLFGGMRNANIDWPAQLDALERIVAKWLVAVGTCVGQPAREEPVFLDSLSATALAVFGETMGFSVSANELSGMQTVATIAIEIGKSIEKSVPPADIFAFPPMSGWSLVYRPLIEQLAGYHLHAFDFAPGAAVADDFARSISAVVAKSRKPIMLLGYSAGGPLAFEVAKHLEARGCAVDTLLLLDAAPRTVLITRSDDELRTFSDEFTNFLTNIGFVGEVSSRSLSLDDARAHVRGRVAAYRRWLDGVVSYGQINARIVLIRAETASEIDSEAVQRWRSLTSKSVDIVRGHGHHLEMLSPDLVGKNAQLLCQSLVAAPRFAGHPPCSPFGTGWPQVPTEF